MPHRFTILCAALLLPFNAWSTDSIVEMQTNLGTITVRLNADKAPVTVANFLAYAAGGFYDRTIVHRAVKGFVIQGGGYDLASGKLKATLAPITNEANNGLSNVVGTISMARTDDPNSATSQFFINLKNNASLLDYREQNAAQNIESSAGYAVFGEVVAGMEVANAIDNSVTFRELPYTADSELVYIEKVYTSEDLDPAVSITRVQTAGEGKVTSSPKGINCAGPDSSCELSLPTAPEKLLTLKAKPAKNVAFVGWSGDCAGHKTAIKLPQTQHHNCTAHFKALSGASLP